jgi:hypothetical protein
LRYGSYLRKGERENGWLLLCDAQPKNCGVKNVAIEDKSNINNTKQILERVTFTSKGFCHTWF